MSYKEKSNESRLQEVLNCSNCPQQEKDLSLNDIEWFESFKKQFVSYVNMPVVNGYRSVTYRQPVKGARQQAVAGIQSFQKDIRSYILTGDDNVPFYEDIDICNCHPELLAQIFEMYDIPTPCFLMLYNANRNGTIKKYNLKDKTAILAIMNNSVLIKNEKKIIKEFHDAIYKKLIPLLVKEAKFKTYIRTKNNAEGSFISSVLQYYENLILNCMVKKLKDESHTVGILMFDGCMVERTDKEIDLELIEEYIKEQTDFDIKLAKKPVETLWKPVADGVSVFEEYATFEEEDEYDIEYALSLSDDNEKLIPYLNQYICWFDNPQCLGWRRFKSDDFLLRAKVSERIGAIQFKKWSNSNQSKKYKGLTFKLENNTDTHYNLYKRPQQTKGDKPEMFLNFIKEIICNNDLDVYEYIVQYIHTLIKTGKTRQCIVMMGLKGTGKSTFIDILADLVGKEYYTPVNDIQRLTSNFNSIYEKSILIGVEEVVSSAGDYHKVQNTLKTLITEDYKTIEKKGIDSYNIECYNNYIISTNGFNPVQVTEDNRRYMILDVSDAKKGDNKYFKELKEYINENVEQIRYYFNEMEFDSSLASNRPTTKKELELMELNLSPTDRFIRDEMKFDKDYLYADMYDIYIEYCKVIGENKVSSKYFSNSLKAAGYKTVKKGASNKTYIKSL